MEEVLDIYKQPYDANHPVVCMDESSKQLTKEVRQPLPMTPKIAAENIEEQSKPGQVERYDTEYERNGTASIFMAFEPLKGVRFTSVTEQRTKKDWAEFIKELVDDHYAGAEKIILVVDNLNTHHKSSLYEAFEPSEAKRIADKLEIHYTPKHGSWLNMAEIELSHLSRQCLDHRIEDRILMAAEVKAWTDARNERKVIANWQFTVADARIKLLKLYPTVL
jgi:transposase